MLSVIEIGHGHAILEVQRAQAPVGGVDVSQIAVHNTGEGVLEGLLLEGVLFGRLSRRSGFGDAPVGNYCRRKHQRDAPCKSIVTKEATHTIESTSRFLRGPRLTRALASGSDLVLRAVADLLLEELGLLFDGAEAVFDGIVSGAEVSGDAANVDLEYGQLFLFVEVCMVCLKRYWAGLTFTPEAMIAATSFCQTSTVSQESLPGPAMVVIVCEFACGIVCGWTKGWRCAGVCGRVGRVQEEQCGLTREYVVGCVRSVERP